MFFPNHEDIKDNMGQTADDLARSEEYSRLAIYIESFRSGYSGKLAINSCMYTDSSQCRILEYIHAVHRYI